MSTQFENQTRTDGHFDALYLAARRQHAEALRHAEMERLAHSVERCRRKAAGNTDTAAARGAQRLQYAGWPTLLPARAARLQGRIPECGSAQAGLD